MQLASVSSGRVNGYGVSAFQQIPSGTILFRQGNAPQSAVFLESGWVKLVRLEPDGWEQIVALCQSGSLLAAASLIAGQPYPVTAITLTTCQIHSVPAPAFLELLRTDLQFSWQVHRAQSRQINAHDRRSAQFKSVPARAHLEQLLWQLFRAERRDGATSNHTTGGWKLLVPLQRKDLAQLISVTQEYLSRMLKEMEADGLIRRDKDWLIVPDPERLWRAPEIEASMASDPAHPGEILISEWILA